MADTLILVINPGSTSTKLALYEEESELRSEEVSHPSGELAGFGNVADQRGYRMAHVEQFMDDCGRTFGELGCVAARGGLMRPVAGGVYRVSREMVEDLMLSRQRWGREHASSLGAMLALDIHERHGVPAFTADPVAVDEMDEVARISGVPEIKRRSLFHALNVKAAARMAAGELGGDIGDYNFVVAHIGGGTSVAALRRGCAVDVNNALLGMGPFSPQRAGALPTGDLVALCYEGGVSRDELEHRLIKKSGLMGILGTDDVREVERMVNGGDERARLALDAMAYQTAKEIAAMAAALYGDVDAVVITGGVARSARFVSLVSGRVGFIAPVMVYPGQREMEALAGYGLAAITGQVKVMEYGQDS